MNDQQLRALVREAVARHLGRDASARPPAPTSPAAVEPPGHPSHHVYLTVVNAGDACVIEPAVTCDHCGYCRSHGH